METTSRRSVMAGGLAVTAAILAQVLEDRRADAGLAPLATTTIRGCGRRHPMSLDGFLITTIPQGVGDKQSTFSYEWEDVGFETAVWETGPDADDGYVVDLNVMVMRGSSLADPRSVRDFLTTYLERDPAEWKLTEYQHGSDSGFTGDAETFWSAGPGVAVVVKVDAERFGREELLAVAEGIRAA